MTLDSSLAFDRFLHSFGSCCGKPTIPRLLFISRLLGLRANLLAAIIFALAFASPIMAQIASPLSPPDRSSPRDWVASFLMEADRFVELYAGYSAERTTANARAFADQLDVLRGFFDLGSVPPAFRDKVGGEAATELIDILNRLPQDAILSGPADPVGSELLPDYWSIPGTEVVLVRRADGMNSGAYVVPQDVFVKMPKFHERMIDAPLLRSTPFLDVRAEQIQATGPMVPQSLVDILPRALKHPILGTPIWKQIVAVCLFLLVLWMNVWWLQVAKRSVNRLPEAMAGILRLSGPVLLATSFALFHVFIEDQLNVQGLVALSTLLIRNLSLIATGAWLVWTFITIVAEMLISSEGGPNKRLDAHLTRLVGKIIGAIGATAAVIYGLSSIGIPAAGLITSLGVGGVGIALAARVTIENLFGGLVLLIDRPFRVGDWIEIAAGSGRVKDIGGRSCRIETAEGTQIVIPNSALSAQPITNLGRGPDQRLRQVLPLSKGMTGADIERRLAAVRAIVQENLNLDSSTRASSVRLISGPDGTLQIEVDVAVLRDSISDFDTIRTETLLALQLLT